MSAQGDAFYEWLLSDHPDARAERERRREAHHQSEIERAGQVQAWVAKIDATPDAPEAIRRLADSLRPTAEKARARAEAAIAVPDEAYVAREREIWATFKQVSSPDGLDYRYPDRYIGKTAAGQPKPPEPDPQAEADIDC